MKKYMIMVLLLLGSTATFAQAKKDSKNDNQKWKVRLRMIAAIPPSTSYDLSGSDVKISASVVPELDFTYFFTKNLAAELILGTTHHKVTLKGAGAETKLGKVWALPPTLNVQYHLPVGNFTPYIGLGINYTIFYGVTDDAAKLSYKNNVGFSTQLGMDYKISKKWFVNLDVKKLFLKTDVTVKGTTPTVLSNVKVDPFIIGLGVGVRL
jgi:outer membrane protein